jgi:hypothetical protein
MKSGWLRNKFRNVVIPHPRGRWNLEISTLCGFRVLARLGGFAGVAEWRASQETLNVGAGKPETPHSEEAPFGDSLAGKAGERGE